MLACLALWAGSGQAVSTSAAPAENAAAATSDTATAGALAALPARGLAAAIAEAGRIEVPSADPSESLSIRATQAARWTEGSYDVWHLTGGVRIAQGSTAVSAHEAVIWIEQAAPPELASDSAAVPPIRTIVVRMAGDVHLQSGGEAASQLRGPRWAGRFWISRDPTLDFASVVPAAGTPPVYDAPADVLRLPAVDGTGGEAVSFERWVDVNRSASQVTLFEGDSAVGMYWAATSEDTSDDGFYATAVGTWSVQEKVADLTWSEYAQAYIADWVGFDPDRENGFHSYSLDSYGNVLENGAAPTLGCVALSPEAADHLYQFVDIGTRVEIHW